MIRQSSYNTATNAATTTTVHNVLLEEVEEARLQAKEEKRILKLELKSHRKCHKLEKTIRHAIMGKNQMLEAKARMELKEQLLVIGGGAAASNTSITCTNSNSNSILSSNHHRFLSYEEDGYHHQEAMKRFIIEICMDLTTQCSTLKPHMDLLVVLEEDAQQCYKEIVKAEQTKHCRVLMRQMSLGTQTKESFRQNQPALWGYTRQKFYERAMLVCTSLFKLKPVIDSDSSSIETMDNHHDTRKRLLMWEQLGKVKHACSLGAGPGNDLVGLVSFLSQYQQPCKQYNSQSTTNSSNNFRLKQQGTTSNSDTNLSVLTKQDDDCSTTSIPAILTEEFPSSSSSDVILQSATALDWVEEEWRCVLEPLMNLLAPKYVQHCASDNCDITQPILSVNENDTTSSPSCSATSVNCVALACAEQCDIFLISYLLTENHGRWNIFFHQLFHSAKSGALFYFAEPTSWQLQKLLRMMETNNNNNSTDMVFMWLDSSMNFPKLQDIDGRLGPAVLLGMKI